MQRRGFLAAATTGATMSLSGCTGVTEVVASLPAPKLSEKRLKEGGWEKQSSNESTLFEREYGGQKLTAKSHSVMYTDAELQQEVSDKTLGQVSSPVSTLFAARIDSNPDINNIPVVKDQVQSQIQSKAETQFKTRLKDQGAEGITESSTNMLQMETGESVQFTQYEATIPFQDVSFPVTDDKSITLDSEGLMIEAWLGTWNHGDYTFLGGGAFPSENFATKSETEISSAINITVDIDLELTPSAYRDEVLGILKSIH